ncbi:Cytochrome P450 4d2, partial [Physocladia obscura]
YLDQVVKEAQRLHAVVPIVSRSVKNDVEHDGYIIPANAILVLSIRGVQLDPKFWKNPEIFDPERWEDPSSIAANSFLPFGEGPHNCIGQKMAVIEMKIILINLLSRFTLELIEDQEINFINTITLGLKNGLKLKVFAD